MNKEYFYKEMIEAIKEYDCCKFMQLENEYLNELEQNDDNFYEGLTELNTFIVYAIPKYSPPYD